MKNLIFLIFIVIISFSCQSEKQPNSNELNGKLVIFHAGSLSVPFKELADSFQMLHPQVEVLMESAGSMACARKLTDLEKTCDILAVSDYKVIDEMLIPNFASKNYKFANNEMVIAYLPNSHYENEINSTNWPEILLKKEVIYGRSDPNSDPCGYRSAFVMQLAEKELQIPGIYQKLLSKNTEYIRPKEVDLLGLLESNAIDYIFIYKSVAQQHHLKFLTLPDSINLKNPELDSLYRTASLQIVGDKPNTTKTVFGEAMIYSFTIPSQSPNAQAAKEFAKYLQSPAGKRIMEKNGQGYLEFEID